MNAETLWNSARYYCVAAQLDRQRGEVEASDLALDRASMILAACAGDDILPAGCRKKCANRLKN